MQVRHRSWLLATLVVGILLAPLMAVGSVASPAEPVSVAIESVGIASQTGCAVLHIATSAPTPVKIDRQAGGRLVAEFSGAVLAPQATGALDRTPALRGAVTIRQSGSRPTVVRLEATSPRGDTPAVERFADGRGLLVRLLLEPPTSPPSVPAARGGAPQVPRWSAAVTGAPEVRIAAVGDPRSTPVPTTPTPNPPAKSSTLDHLLRTVSALTGLGMPSLTASLEPRTAEQPVRVAALLTALPVEVLAARPEPRAARPMVRRLRLVEMSPLTVAVDCSQPLPYTLEPAASGSGYVLLIPNARLDPNCERSIALHPAAEARISAEEREDGVAILIPTAEGETCLARVGASPSTVVCEVVAAGAAAAQTPPPEPTGEALINLDFQEAPVIEILTALAKYANRNIVATTAVSGTMSVHLSEVTLTQALDVIVAINDLQYALVGDKNYIVGTAEEIARLAPTSGAGRLPLQMVYKPERTTPERIAREMKDLAEKAGVTIKIVEDTKSVVFTDVPDQETAERLRELASELDVPSVETTRWMQLEHITPAEAAAALGGLVANVEVRMPGPEAPQVSVIGLTGKTVDVDQAEGLLATIDIERPQIEEEPPGAVVSRTLLVTYVDPEQVVSAITSVFADKVQVVVVTSKLDTANAMDTEKSGGLRPTGRILITGPESVVDAAEDLLADLDAPPPQVQITATITDVRVDRDKNVGFQWDLPGLTISEEQTAGDGFRFGKFVRAPLNASGSGPFSASFDATVQDTNATVLSRTTLIALQGKTANFLVGDIIPYETSVAADGTVTRSVEFEEIGLGLKFAPTVDAQDRISLYMSPRVRSFTGFSPQGYPIIATREAQTILRCNDGDIVAIGGLLRDEEIKTLSGIPFLKDIPFFGELFKKRQTQKRKSEVVVFAEIKLLRPEEQPARIGAAEDMGR